MIAHQELTNQFLLTTKLELESMSQNRKNKTTFTTMDERAHPLLQAKVLCKSQYWNPLTILMQTNQEIRALLDTKGQPPLDILILTDKINIQVI
jgi:hypothetical protein